MSDEVTETHEIKKKEKYEDKVVVRAYSKGIYFYPSAIIGIIISVLDALAKPIIINNFGFTEPKYDTYIAAIWFVIFAFNIIVISFDFTLGKIFTISVLIFALILVYTIAFPEGIAGLSVTGFLDTIDMTASPSFYLMVSLLIIIIILVDFIRSRFNYWEFESNRIIHHRGIFEREMSFSAQNSRVTTQIDDIFEFILFLSGTILIQDPDKHIYVLENVFGANGKDKKIQELLTVIKVRES